MRYFVSLCFMDERIHSLNTAFAVSELQSFSVHGLLISTTRYEYGSAQNLCHRSHVAETGHLLPLLQICVLIYCVVPFYPFCFSLFSPSVSVALRVRYVYQVTTTGCPRGASSSATINQPIKRRNAQDKQHRSRMRPRELEFSATRSLRQNSGTYFAACRVWVRPHLLRRCLCVSLVYCRISNDPRGIAVVTGYTIDIPRINEMEAFAK